MPKTQFTASHQPKVPPKRLLGAALAVLLFCLLLSSVIRLAEKYFAVRARNRELATETVALQQKQASLEATNAYLSSPAGVEESLRERYNDVKPGEGMIIVTPQTPAVTAAPQPAVIRWWNDLFH